MSNSSNLQWGLEDLLADLRHGRRTNDMGRLALIAYCEVRRWAREAGETAIAERSARLVTNNPHSSRADFFSQIDDLIRDLEGLQPRYQEPQPSKICEEPQSPLTWGNGGAPCAA